MSAQPRCKNLVLDAGPLLSLSPLRGLAETYYTAPQILQELKDVHARQHLQRLGLSAGVRIEIKEPDAAALIHVIQFAKRTGDYAVLSHADLCVLALTYSLDVKGKAEVAVDTVTSFADETRGSSPPSSTADVIGDLSEVLDRTDLGKSTSPVRGSKVYEDDRSSCKQTNQDDEDGLQGLPSSIEPPSDDFENLRADTKDLHQSTISQTPILFNDPSDEEDGEGEWITPSNIAIHKSRALNLLPSDNGKGKGKAAEIMHTGCMTADFAVQNVLLQMGLNLVSVDGKRIEKVKNWVLRCHACFKICKDNSKKFCPSCGNATLLRASVTVTSPTASPNAPGMTVHLKKNYQYRKRGTIYSIPSPHPGSAKGGTGEGLILREDQTAWVRATKKAEGQRAKEEKRMMKGLMGKGGLEQGVVMGSWMDPDWIPGIMSASAGGKGRTDVGNDGVTIGYGRRNPNERRRKR